MEILLVILALNLAVIIHEAGHAIALRKSKIEIEEIALGWPIIPVRIVSRIILFRGKPIRYSIYPLLIGAFVKPTPDGEKQTEKLPLQEKMGIYWAGPYANLVSGLIVLLPYRFLGSSRSFFTALIIISIIIFVFSIPYLVKKKSIGLMVPILSILALGFIIWSFATAGGKVMGPVGIISQSQELMSGGFFFLFILLSLNLGIVNLLPISPLDGGRAVFDLLRETRIPKRALEIIAIAGVGIITVLFIIVFANDIANLFR